MPKYIFNLTFEGAIEAESYTAAYEKLIALTKELEKTIEGDVLVSRLDVTNNPSTYRLPLDR